jgi:peptide chain release factor 1
MDDGLRSKLAEIAESYAAVLAEMATPEVAGDPAAYHEATMRHAELKPIVATYDRYVEGETELSEAVELLEAGADEDLAEYLTSIAETMPPELERLEAALHLMLVPKDPNDAKDVIVEIRAAAGGEEAALWASDLYRMYERFAERSGWRIEPMDTSPTGTGGIKEATFAVKGQGAFSRFKFEAGPHRVQRVPKTESQGRIHTSMATVAVLPEVEEVEVQIDENDLDIDRFRSQGPGGQSVNTTDSAIRITHKPTGIVVQCQDEKSQLQNLAKAMRVLRARLHKIEMEQQVGERADARRSQVGTGERSEKIRTYNFKENRVTDHRIGLTLHSLPEILDGDLTSFHEGLAAADAAERLSGHDTG